MSFSSDFKVGMRQIGKHPGNALLAVLAYGVGLGLVGLILALYFGIVRGHPKDIDFDRIYFLRWDPDSRHLWKEGFQSPQFRIHDVRDFHQRADLFENFAASRNGIFSLLVGRHAEQFNGEFVTAEYFDVVKAVPHRGSFFQPGDDQPGAPRKAVISHHLWQQHFNSSDAIVGRDIIVNGSPATVIGIAPPGFDFPARKDLWLNDTNNPDAIERGSGDLYEVLATLKPDASLAAAIAQLNAIAQQLQEAYPSTNTGYVSVDFRPLSAIFIDDQTREMVYLLLACATLVLVIACANVANLTLARSTTRVKELAIRSSLGGRRARLVTQMLVEGLAVALLGGVLGLIVTIWGSKAIWAWITSFQDVVNVPSWMGLDADLRVVLALSGFTLFACLVASIVPALQASRTNVNDILKDNARGATGLRIGIFSKILALLQITVSAGILIATLALVSAAREGADFDPPYRTDGLFTAAFELPSDRYPTETRAALLDNLQQTFESRDGVSHVGFTTSVDMLFNWGSRWEVRGQPADDADDLLLTRHEIVSDNYFDVLDVPVLYGRNFQPVDASPDARKVCIINLPLAEKLSPGNPQGALGMELRDSWESSNPYLSIVGIVPDTRMAGPGRRTQDELAGVFRPLSQGVHDTLTVFARAEDDPLVAARQIQAALREIDPGIALYRIKTHQEAVKEANFGLYFYRNMFGLFGIAALLLASVGVYGVMSFSVRQRFQEFSIRQALGASPSTIFRHIVRLGSIQITTGLVMGLLLGWALLQVIGAQFGGTVETQALNYLIPLATLAAISALALYSPSRYVTRANLSHSLRDE